MENVEKALNNGRLNSDPWMYKAVKEGKGRSLEEALTAALTAEAKEPIVKQVMEG